ncbi:hypothetical protein [Streptomyces sp. NPDC048269]|uniref:hypothetical protein n=1 Tax=Streptomyces sp. NPDC048269 TaxID=3155753 RepID=UPI0034205A92
MVDEMAAGLAVTGATTLVTPTSSSAWEAARTGVVQLFRRAGTEEHQLVEAQLEQEASLVQRDEDPERVRRDFHGGRKRKLIDLPRAHPEVVGELRDLVASVQAQLPREGMSGAVQWNTTTGNATGNFVQGGDALVL